MTLPAFDETHLGELAAILGNEATHAELTTFFARLVVEGADPSMGSKTNRIRIGLAARQRRDRCGNTVGAFIELVIAPVRFTSNARHHDEVRESLNRILAFSGLTVGADGKLKAVPKAKTVSEAHERAGRLSRKLTERGVHGDVLRFCKPELVDGNYFHAVLEATKSVADKVRVKAGLKEDGAELFQRAFGVKQPLLAINALTSPTMESEQKGFMNFLTGLLGMFRNTTAHAAKVTWSVTEEDALDLLTMVSYAHRRLDLAVRTHHPSP